MDKKAFLTIVRLSATSAIVVVVVLKLLGHDNPTVIGGAVAGGVAGAIGAYLSIRKKV